MYFLHKFKIIILVLILFCILPSSVISQSCCIQRGDVDYNGGSNSINISDVLYLVNYFFLGGPAPPCPDQADVNNDGDQLIDIKDITYLVDYMFLNGPAPINCESDILPDSTHIANIVIGNSVYLDSLDMHITFDSVIQDNRCPIGVFCFWEGMAEIAITIELNESSHQLVMPIMGYVLFADGYQGIPIEVFGYRFTLLALNPYPNNMSMNPVDMPYATIAVKKITSPMYADSEILLTNGSWVEMQTAPVIDSVRVFGKYLKIDLTRSGGCVEHYFPTYLSPAGFFGAIFPRSANLYVLEFGDEDDCDALIHETRVIDMQPLIDKYIEDFNSFNNLYLHINNDSILFAPFGDSLPN